MKTKLLVIAFLSFITFSYANRINGLPEFPAYAQSMDLGFDCDANCTFSNCSASGNCYCYCSWFSCRCKKEAEEEALVKNESQFKIDVSMNEIQYQKTKDFALFIKNINTDSTDEVYVNLCNLVEALKNKDATEFYRFKSEYLTSILKLDEKTKNELNNYFIKIGAVERI